MATRLLTVDDATGKRSLATIGSLFFIENFDVAISGTTFTLSSNFDNTSVIEVWKNGQLVREGSSYDFTRDSALNQIIFNAPVDEGAWVSIKVWL